MKTKLILMLTILLLTIVSSIKAQTTNITYQGRLTDNSMAANGTYQMRFLLFNEPFGGTQSGSTIELTNVQVTNGVFTVQLDFGTDPFPFGEARYLQLEVRRDAGEVYTPLSPRQQVTTTPYSIRTLIANSAENSFRLGNVDANQYVQTNDSRLSDARTPTSGSGNYIQNRTTTQISSNFDISGTGEASVFNARTQFSLNQSRILSSPGTNNTFVGINNGTDITTGERNTFIGRDTGPNTTTGSRNTFTGAGSGLDNISGSDNSFYGFNSGLRITSGRHNSFFGVSAGSGNLTGQNNAFFGYEAGLLATGGNNSFFGSTAGRATTSGVDNSFFGEEAGIKNETGSFSVYIGSQSGKENTSGSSNVFVGYLAGDTNVSGSNNTVIGTSADVLLNNSTFATAIGAGAVVTTSNTVQIGRNNQDLVRIGRFTTGGFTDQICKDGFNNLALCNSSSLRYKENVADFRVGLDTIKKLNPIIFSWKKDGRSDIGFGAEDVEIIDPLFVIYDDRGQVEGVRYDRLGVLFVNAFKEQQTQIETQAEANKQLKSKIETLETELDEQKRQFENLRLLVCADKPEAEICRSKTENNENN